MKTSNRILYIYKKSLVKEDPLKNIAKACGLGNFYFFGAQNTSPGVLLTQAFFLLALGGDF